MSTADSAVARCSYCDAGPATGKCRICGRPVCEQHLGDREADELACLDCSLKVTLGDVGHHVAEKEASLLEGTDFREGPGPVRRALRWPVFGLVVGALVFVYQPVAARLVQATPHYALGPVGDGAPGLDACIEGLWRVRASFDEFRYRNGGRLPEGLDALGGDCPGRCPGCGEAWAYVKGEDGAYAVACPEPAAHERSAVFISHRHGPPRVRLASRGEIP
jgi:hypothetical protein